jgi:hypothetical protein
MGRERRSIGGVPVNQSVLAETASTLDYVNRSFVD